MFGACGCAVWCDCDCGFLRLMVVGAAAVLPDVERAVATDEVRIRDDCVATKSCWYVVKELRFIDVRDAGLPISAAAVEDERPCLEPKGNGCAEVPVDNEERVDSLRLELAVAEVAF